ncbi:MAG TPA: hypothetical protein VGQ83_15990 [Polyangia bacterium]|jgi:hypothetical protein
MDPAPTPAATADALTTLGTGALRLPDVLLGGLRTLALEVIVILGVGGLAGLLHFVLRGTPHVFADFWTAGTYLTFALGAPLAAQTLLDDLRYPDLLDWWPGGLGSRVRLRMPSTTPWYLVVDAVPIAFMALVLREPQSRGPLGYVMAAATLVVGGGAAGMRLWSRRRLGPAVRGADESASVEEPPAGGRAVLAGAAMVVPLAALIAALAALHASLALWLAGIALYLGAAALLKRVFVGRGRALVAAPPPAPAARKGHRGRR